MSKLEEAASAAASAVQGLEAGRQGAEIKGGIAAAAGAGGVSVGSGSVLRTAAAVDRAIGRRVALANLNTSATRAAGAYQREVLQHNITRANLNYQDTLRGLDTREAQTEAQTTLTEYQQETGLEQADLLQSEADWIRDWGIPLTKLGGALATAGALVNTGLDVAGRMAPAATGGPGWGGTGMQPEAVHGYLGGYGAPSFAGGGVRTEFATGGSY